MPKFEVLGWLTSQQLAWLQVKDLAGHTLFHGNDHIISEHAGGFGELKTYCIYSLSCDKTYDEMGLMVMSVMSRVMGF